jgi:hypothetical protein
MTATPATYGPALREQAERTVPITYRPVSS